MKFIEWNESMSVGSPALDGHHQMILECLNRLHPLIGAAGRDDEIHRVVGALEDFILIHFSEEERTMILAGYPDWRSHKGLHDKLYDEVFKLKCDIDNGRPVDAGHLFEFIYDWLIKHILGEDAKYAPYLKGAVHHAAAAVWDHDQRGEA
jgi:hemerythrin-like metal-binding protein